MMNDAIKVMIDSGAHSLYTKEVMRKEDNYDYYESDDFWAFVDSYAAFIKENKDNIDTYVNVDVIFNPELTWKVQRYMEDVHKLSPLPVFHSGEDFKWLKMYVENYDHIGMSGLGQRAKKAQWIKNVGDPAFRIVCDDKGMPKVKVHGFAMTSPDLMVIYPYHSVDSGSWFQFGKYGLIIVPKKRNGKFIYDESPHIISVSTRKTRKMEAENFDHLPDMEKKAFMEYIEMKGFKMGSSELEEVAFDNTKVEFPIGKTEISDKEVVIEQGICNNSYIRDELNLQFYLDAEKNIPPWPRPWKKLIKATQFPF